MIRKYKIFSWISIAVAVAVFILVNVFMTMLTKKTQIKIDLTADKLYDLTSESYEYLDGYDKDTTIYIISSAANEDPSVRAVLDRYAAANSHIKITNVDTQKDPGFGREYVKNGGQLAAGDLVVAAGDKSRIIERSKLSAQTEDGKSGLNVETKVTSALKYVSGGDEFTAYFTTGHNENGFDTAKDALGSENYTCESIDLYSGDIPDGASVVIVALPRTDFSTAEIAKLDAYARSGGAIEVYVDSECPELPNLNEYLTSNGITVTQLGIVESRVHVRSYRSSDGQHMLFAADYGNNGALDGIIRKGRPLLYMPYSKLLKTAATAGNIKVLPYLISSEGSKTTTDYRSIEDGGANNIALMSENSETGGMIYVSGMAMLLDAYSVSDIDENEFANVDYFVTVTNTMTGAGDTFVVPVKAVSQDTMSMNVAARRVYTFIIIILVPGTALAAGLAVFFKRRNM